MFFGFFCMHFIAGFIMTLVFQLAHVVEETSYPVPTEQHELENSWAVHQLLTTADFSPHNKFISWWVGGLNFQIEHHLFPNICHVHYPAIAPIVRQTAEEFGLPYYQFASIGEAIQSHFGRHKALGAAAAQVPADLPAI
jgi:linoleoyl-CoA desaturase